MQIRVEFFGLARRWAGVAECELLLPAGATLGVALRVLAEQLPAFADRGLPNGQLHPVLTVNLGGERFARDPATPLTAGECLLLLSADAGG